MQDKSKSTAQLPIVELRLNDLERYTTVSTKDHSRSKPPMSTPTFKPVHSTEQRKRSAMVQSKMLKQWMQLTGALAHDFHIATLATPTKQVIGCLSTVGRTTALGGTTTCAKPRRTSKSAHCARGIQDRQPIARFCIRKTVFAAHATFARTRQTSLTSGQCRISVDGAILQ